MTDFIHEMRSPTLLIGVGGIGGQIVNEVNKHLTDFDRTKIKLMVMDTNVNDLDKFIGTNITYVQTSKNQTVESYLTANPEYLEWFPQNLFINSKNLIQGAGQIRSVSRLGGLSCKAEGKFNAIDSAIQEILINEGDSLIRSIRVMIVGSITGGTGSGLGIQLPFYIRNVFENEGVPNTLIRGMFLMPSLTEGCQDTEAKEKAVNVNGYAFLKELNALYRMQTVKSTENILRIEEYTPGLGNENDANMVVSSGKIPYDFLFLVERANEAGNLGGLNEYIERSAKIVISQLFTPIGEHGMSSEDNLITRTVETSGMSRYCAAGLARAIYPKSSIMRYCTLKFAQSMIGGYWSEIDRRFSIADKQNRILKKSNPALANLDRGTQYREIFNDLCDPQKNDVISELNSIRNEVMTESTITDNNDGKKRQVFNPTDELICNSIKQYLDEAFELQQFTTLKDACALLATEKSSPNSVITCIDDSIAALTSLKSKITEHTNNVTASTVEAIFPSNLDSAKAVNSNSSYNIYAILNDLHPIAVRFLLYGIFERLTNMKAKIDSNLNGLREENAKRSIFVKDYNPDTPEIDTPSASISQINLGWLKALSIYSDAYKAKVRDIKEDINTEASRIVAIALHSYKSTVLSSVLERLGMLIKIYENFFDELDNIKQAKADEAVTLELGIGTGVNRTLAGDRYICDAPVFRNRLYEEFQDKISGKDLEMSSEVKVHFFDEMFTLFATELQLKNDPSSNITKKSLSDIFENGILTPICDQFKDTGYKHLDMSIIEAIYKQYSIITPNAPDRKSPEFNKYFNDICTSLVSLASPYLMHQKQVPGYKAGGKESYAWGINATALAHYQNGSSDGDVNKTGYKALIGSSDNYRDFIADDSYDKAELVCYATLYDLLIENCISYKVGSRPESLYSERLENYVNRENYVLSNETDDVLNVIHPHLDKRWHEHAYLPELMDYDDKKMVADITRAYLLALALGKCAYTEDKIQHLSCWRYQYRDKASKTPIFVDQKELVAKSLYSLYEAFDRNRGIVKDVLDTATAIRKASKDQASIMGISEEDVLNHEIIASLCNINVKVLNTEEKMGSVLDLIFRLYAITRDFTFAKNMIADLKAYLKDYAMFIRGSEHPANYTYTQIIKKIGKSTICVTDTDGTPDDFIAEVADFISDDAKE